MKLPTSSMSRWWLGSLILFTLSLGGGIRPVTAYEVWLTDQSDTGKESGGFLYIYDGAQLSGNPATAKPTQTIDFSGDLGKFCEEAGVSSESVGAWNASL